MSVSRVLFEQDGPVAIITFDNQPKRNAISLQMWNELAEALHQIEQSENIRCVMLRGAGETAFVSGADINEFMHERGSQDAQSRYDEAGGRALSLLRGLRQPTIAAISGHCIGGGVAIILCCDIRICDDDATFGIPAARLGVSYGWESTSRLVSAIGPGWAADLLFSGRFCDAEDARRMQLVTQIYPRDEFAAKSRVFADSVAQNAPLSIRASKIIINQVTAARRVDVALYDQLAAVCMASDDYAEGARAFREKRRPQFAGR